MMRNIQGNVQSASPAVEEDDILPLKVLTYEGNILSLNRIRQNHFSQF